MKKSLSLFIAFVLAMNTIMFAQNYGENSIWSTLPFGQFPWTNIFDVNDLNNDGLADVVFGSQNSSSEHRIYAQFNSSSSPVLIGTVEQGSIIDFENINYFFSPADPDADGDIDYLALHTISEITYLYWFENDGSGSFAPGTILFDVPSTIISVRLADVNQDGYSDIHIDHWDGWSICAGTASGTFEAPVSIPYTCPAFGVVFGDLDADGLTDFVHVSDNSNFSFHIGTGNGNYTQNNSVIQPGLTDLEYNRKVRLADLDGDADLDLVLNENSDIRWCENQGEAFFGDVSDQPIFHDVISTDYFTQANVFDIEDIDNDGDLDILGDAVTGFEPDEIIRWFENNSAGVFLTHTIQDVTNLQCALFGDINNDGLKDLFLFGDNGDISSKINISNVGCNDPSACNYNEIFTIDDGSCCYGTCGCPDNNNVDCDDGSCLYTQTGFVFHDINANGIWDSDEEPLANQIVMIYPDNIMATTNNDGAFVVDVPYGQYQVSVLTNDNFPLCTTENDIENTLWIFTDDFYFGLSESVPSNDIHIQMESSITGYPCDDLVYHTLCITNTGNSTSDVVVALTLDILYQDNELFSAADSVANNVIYFSYDGLASGASHCFYMNLHTPTVDYLGTILTSHIVATAIQDGQVVSLDESLFTKELACAYDPNDKAAEPIGYADEHYILDDSEVEFLVRFQNTGNAPATDVIVLDTIDAGFDLSTFGLLSHSHDMNLSIYPESRTIAFQFYNIMLPDSFSNEEESHGFFKYSLRIQNGLNALDELRNTAFIYFDNNPAVVTNTTWHTIFDCSLVNTELTSNFDTLFAAPGLSYQWYHNDQAVANANDPYFMLYEGGNYYAQITHPLGCVLFTDTLMIISNHELSNQPSNYLLWPNPMDNTCVLATKNTLPLNQVNIISITGEILRTYSNIASQRLIIDRSSLASGLYFVQIIGPIQNQTQTLKLVIH